MPEITSAVGRQPILDRNLDLFGYELLFRARPTSVSSSDPGIPYQRGGDDMTSDVIVNTLDIGLRRLVGTASIFVNADRGVLTGNVPVDLPPERTVIEVLETVLIDDEILAGCRALKRAGYRLAADDFVWFVGAEALLELVDIVKIDIRAIPLSDIPDVVDHCRIFGVDLLAEKVETSTELTGCMDLGFDLFQGYYLGEPTTFSGRPFVPHRRPAVPLAG